jgi:hypothetical protein
MVETMTGSAAARPVATASERPLSAMTARDVSVRGWAETLTRGL